MYTEEQSTYVGYFKPPFSPHWKAGTFVWCVPFLSCPYGLLLFPHMYILFCSLFSGTEAVRECPHPVAYPLISSDYLWSWGTLCICSLIYLIATLMRCVLYTDLSLRPCLSRKKGVGTKKKKEEKDPSLLTPFRVPVTLYVFLLSLLSSLNEMHICKPFPHSPGLRFCWLYLADYWLSWQRCLQELTQELSLKCAKKTSCAEGFPPPLLATES